MREVVLGRRPRSTTPVAKRIHGLLDKSWRLGRLFETCILPFVVIPFRIPPNMNFFARGICDLLDHLVKAALLIRIIKRFENIVRYKESIVVLMHISLSRNTCQCGKISKGTVADRD